jgi:hypothetical protein
LLNAFAILIFEQVQEGYRVMYAWEQPRPIVALTMLNDHFPDPKVRGYASLCLERMRDETLSQYILQLTQTLKHEPFHDSGLGKYIQTKRASIA